MFDYLIGTALMRAVFGAKFDKPTFQKCLGLISFVLIALFITGAGLYRGHDTEARLARLATEAVTGRAAVIDKQETWRSNTAHYEITLEHVTADGVRHRANPDIAKARYDGARVGGSVSITYLRSEPDTFYLKGEEPTAADLSLFRLIFRIGLVCLALTSGLLVWQWPRGGKDDGGGPARRVAPIRPAPAPISPDARDDGPPVFGKRR